MTPDAEALVAELDAILRASQAAEPRGTAGPRQLSECTIIDSFAALHACASSLTESASESLDLLFPTPEPFVRPHQLPFAQVSPRVRVRAVHPPKLRPERLRTERLRVSTLVSHHVIIRDTSEALLMSRGGSSPADLVGIRTTHPALVGFLSAVFETTWGHARSAPDRGPALSLSDSDHLLLEQLALGRTDASIARTLDVCLRTVQRRVQALQRQLGVTSRFQLGVYVGMAEHAGTDLLAPSLR